MRHLLLVCLLSVPAFTQATPAETLDLLYSYEHPIFPESNFRDCLDE